ncbi:hypothetical protein PAP_07430 [Palaeococcus pacificus DY20341]|uniref:Uncharacterized protein n=1 Tax=Palaeococcus pacificus DY20341 TaxID=1343739 RepID=A0A075LUQ6_9EURY|nr:hypothetical protein [Palaeococcus pacificus]AIF69876.1 hypothetical protein PAP_07430 [Palaeococcus pacificus DY20341]
MSRELNMKRVWQLEIPVIFISLSSLLMYIYSKEAVYFGATIVFLAIVAEYRFDKELEKIRDLLGLRESMGSSRDLCWVHSNLRYNIRIFAGWNCDNVWNSFHALLPVRQEDAEKGILRNCKTIRVQ